VLIEGQLFYDNEQLVNSDAAAPSPSQPRRMSLWEIHPITKFLVCDKRECDPSRPSDWTPLEQFTVDPSSLPQ